MDYETQYPGESGTPLALDDQGTLDNVQTQAPDWRSAMQQQGASAPSSASAPVDHSGATAAPDWRSAMKAAQQEKPGVWDAIKANMGARVDAVAAAVLQDEASDRSRYAVKRAIRTNQRAEEISSGLSTMQRAAVTGTDIGTGLALAAVPGVGPEASAAYFGAQATADQLRMQAADTGRYDMDKAVTVGALQSAAATATGGLAAPIAERVAGTAVGRMIGGRLASEAVGHATAGAGGGVSMQAISNLANGRPLTEGMEEAAIGGAWAGPAAHFGTRAAGAVVRRAPTTLDSAQDAFRRTADTGAAANLARSVQERRAAQAAQEAPEGPIPTEPTQPTGATPEEPTVGQGRPEEQAGAIPTPESQPGVVENESGLFVTGSDGNLYPATRTVGGKVVPQDPNVPFDYQVGDGSSGPAGMAFGPGGRRPPRAEPGNLGGEAIHEVQGGFSQVRGLFDRLRTGGADAVVSPKGVKQATDAEMTYDKLGLKVNPEFKEAVADTEKSADILQQSLENTPTDSPNYQTLLNAATNLEANYGSAAARSRTNQLALGADMPMISKFHDVNINQGIASADRGHNFATEVHGLHAGEIEAEHRAMTESRLASMPGFKRLNQNIRENLTNFESFFNAAHKGYSRAQNTVYNAFENNVKVATTIKNKLNQNATPELWNRADELVADVKRYRDIAKGVSSNKEFDTRELVNLGRRIRDNSTRLGVSKEFQNSMGEAGTFNPILDMQAWHGFHQSTLQMNPGIPKGNLKMALEENEKIFSKGGGVAGDVVRAGLGTVTAGMKRARSAESQMRARKMAEGNIAPKRRNLEEAPVSRDEVQTALKHGDLESAADSAVTELHKSGIVTGEPEPVTPPPTEAPVPPSETTSPEQATTTPPESEVPPQAATARSEPLTPGVRETAAPAGEQAPAPEALATPAQHAALGKLGIEGAGSDTLTAAEALRLLHEHQARQTPPNLAEQPAVREQTGEPEATPSEPTTPPNLAERPPVREGEQPPAQEEVPPVVEEQAPAQPAEEPAPRETPPNLAERPAVKEQKAEEQPVVEEQPSEQAPKEPAPDLATKPRVKEVQEKTDKIVEEADVSKPIDTEITQELEGETQGQRTDRLKTMVKKMVTRAVEKVEKLPPAKRSTDDLIEAHGMKSGIDQITKHLSNIAKRNGRNEADLWEAVMNHKDGGIKSVFSDGYGSKAIEGRLRTIIADARHTAEAIARGHVDEAGEIIRRNLKNNNLAPTKEEIVKNFKADLKSKGMDDDVINEAFKRAEKVTPDYSLRQVGNHAKQILKEKAEALKNKPTEKTFIPVKASQDALNAYVEQLGVKGKLREEVRSIVRKATRPGLTSARKALTAEQEGKVIADIHEHLSDQRESYQAAADAIQSGPRKTRFEEKVKEVSDVEKNIKAAQSALERERKSFETEQKASIEKSERARIENEQSIEKLENIREEVQRLIDTHEAAVENARKGGKKEMSEAADNMTGGELEMAGSLIAEKMPETDSPTSNEFIEWKDQMDVLAQKLRAANRHKPAGIIETLSRLYENGLKRKEELPGHKDLLLSEPEYQQLNKAIGADENGNTSVEGAMGNYYGNLGLKIRSALFGDSSPSARTKYIKYSETELKKLRASLKDPGEGGIDSEGIVEKPRK